MTDWLSDIATYRSAITAKNVATMHGKTMGFKTTFTKSPNIFLHDSDIFEKQKQNKEIRN